MPEDEKKGNVHILINCLVSREEYEIDKNVIADFFKDIEI